MTQSRYYTHPSNIHEKNRTRNGSLQIAVLLYYSSNRQTEAAVVVIKVVIIIY